MNTKFRAIHVALLAAFAVSLLFAGTSFAADSCDPAACAAKCQQIRNDSSLTEAQRLEKCKQVCAEMGGKECSAECKAKCEQTCKNTCTPGTKAGATETGLIKTASATSGGCPMHAKATTANATDEAPKTEAQTAGKMSDCAKTCGAEAAAACAATKKSCAMAEKAKEKPE